MDHPIHNTLIWKANKLVYIMSFKPMIGETLCVSPRSHSTRRFYLFWILKNDKIIMLLWVEKKGHRGGPQLFVYNVNVDKVVDSVENVESHWYIFGLPLVSVLTHLNFRSDIAKWRFCVNKVGISNIFFKHGTLLNRTL